MMSLPVMVSTSLLDSTSPAQHLPPVNKRAVRILLECFLVETKSCLKVHNIHLKLAMAISEHDKYFTKKKMAHLRQ